MSRWMFVIAACVVSLSAWGQAGGEDAAFEDLYDQFEKEDVQQKRAQETGERSGGLGDEKDISKLSDLVTLAPFEDVAVIQRRFLPKTGRFEISGLGALNLNNQFFNIMGLGVKASYFLTEQFGLEFSYLMMSSSEKEVTENLRTDQNIQTDSIVEPESYMGLALRWTPIYGKMAWFEQTIVPYDIYFTPGIGMTETAYGESETTYSLGAGQEFALTKGSALRWDITWNFYTATIAVNGVRETTSHNDLILMLGYSLYFPEATYR